MKMFKLPRLPFKKKTNSAMTSREIELIKLAEREIENENREVVLNNQPNPRSFRRFLFPQLTPGGPFGLAIRRLTEDRSNWPENEQGEI